MKYDILLYSIVTGSFTVSLGPVIEIQVLSERRKETGLELPGDERPVTEVEKNTYW
jgi:hypothetical protein